MSIVSQDTPKDQEYSFVDKTSSGKLVTKNNKIRGTPVIIPTQVINDTRTQRFQEKNRRFINVNPDTTSKKIDAAKNIMALQGGYLPDEYDELVVSRLDKERAKQIVRILVAKLKQHSKTLQPKEYGVKIPFALSIVASIPNSNVWASYIHELIDKYYNNPEECFVKGYPELKEIDDSSGARIATIAIATRNNINYQQQIIQKNFLQNNPSLWNNVLKARIINVSKYLNAREHAVVFVLLLECLDRGTLLMLTESHEEAHSLKALLSDSLSLTCILKDVSISQFDTRLVSQLVVSCEDASEAQMIHRMLADLGELRKQYA
jgi:hypothetical protein